jgi:hypothetical protein
MEDHILATADLIRLMEGMRMGQPPIQGDETNAEGAQMRDAYGTGANAQLGNSAGDATSAEAEGRI